jgi:hypothetical protein
MCVSESQNFMQSASVLPPPPGVLGAASLGLDGFFVVTEPPDKGVVAICGDMGGSGAIPGEGWPIADEGAGLGALVAGFDGVGSGVVGPRAALDRDD